MNIRNYENQEGGRIMKVRKRDGRLQEFRIEKIMLSIERASDDVKESMNESDSENISRMIMSEIRKLALDEIESCKLKNIIIQCLNELGFQAVAEVYSKGSK